MKEIKVSEVILDYNLYPRVEVSASHVTSLRNAYKAGIKFPPVLIDKKSKRCVDGFHRITMYLRHDPKMEIEVIEKTYKNDAEIFRHSMRLNSNHGKVLTPYDKTHCIIKAENLKIAPDQIAKDLCITVDALGDLKVDRIGKLKIAGTNKKESIPLKRSIRHMRGKTLTDQQQKINEKLSGMDQLFHVNQIIYLLEFNLLDTSDVRLIERLEHLYSLIVKMKAA